ncbi:hypothetical protein SARC_15236, partial [Sphaeroforma arctica JP610]
YGSDTKDDRPGSVTFDEQTPSVNSLEDNPAGSAQATHTTGKKQKRLSLRTTESTGDGLANSGSLVCNLDAITEDADSPTETAPMPTSIFRQGSQPYPVPSRSSSMDGSGTNPFTTGVGCVCPNWL